MFSFGNPLTRFVFFGLLYVLASPIYLALWLRRILKELRTYQAISRGTVRCPACGAEVSLNRLATCKKCGATELGSVFYCSFCKTVSTLSTIDCDRCGVTIRLG